MGNMPGNDLASSAVRSHGLEPYRYAPLADSAKDIRLVELLPGGPLDEVRVKIYHVALEELTKPARKQMTLAQIKALLPPRWDVSETIEGRFIFLEDKNPGWRPQWKPPIDALEPSSYMLPADVNRDFKPRYEALSYTWGSDGSNDTIFVVVDDDDDDNDGRERTSAAVRGAAGPVP